MDFSRGANSDDRGGGQIRVSKSNVHHFFGPLAFNTVDGVGPDARKHDPSYTSSPTPLPANHTREIPMTEERKYAVLFAATILAARQLADLGDLADRPCPARDIVLAKAIEKAEMILRKIDQK
jgi:hypothetical protein